MHVCFRFELIVSNVEYLFDLSWLREVKGHGPTEKLMHFVIE